jgi:hypothetical protein
LIVPIATSRLDATFYALDEQPAMLDFLHNKLDAQLISNVVPIDPEHAASLAGTIDRVLAVNVLHELTDDELGTLRDFLCADGFAVIVDWNALVERPAGPPRERCYTPEQAQKRLQGLGFTVTPLESFTYHHAFLVRPDTAT